MGTTGLEVKAELAWLVWALPNVEDDSASVLKSPPSDSTALVAISVLVCFHWSALPHLYDPDLQGPVQVT